jgi:hypothetical protein
MSAIVWFFNISAWNPASRVFLLFFFFFFFDTGALESWGDGKERYWFANLGVGLLWWPR